MTLTTITRPDAPSGIARTGGCTPRAPRISLRGSRFHLDPRSEPRTHTAPRWIGELVVRR